jgi:hypothetical protein
LNRRELRLVAEGVIQDLCEPGLPLRPPNEPGAHAQSSRRRLATSRSLISRVVRELPDRFVPRHDKAKNLMPARVRATARRTHGRGSPCFAVATAIFDVCRCAPVNRTAVRAFAGVAVQIFMGGALTHRIAAETGGHRQQFLGRRSHMLVGLRWSLAGYCQRIGVSS